MKLSISNIAWDFDNDNKIYALMKKYSYEGVGDFRTINLSRLLASILD